MKSILSGSIFQQYIKCGKRNCKCREDDKYKHGPYWTWTKRVNGKNTLKRLSEKQAKKAQRYIKNNKEALAELEARRAETENQLFKE